MCLAKPFFAPGGSDPFFVKNLENIQGDERDVIFISVGYSRDADGYMAMNFGPLQTDGGERRLNVLISRARDRCEVFSSITPDEIDLTRARSRGAQAFKTFLSFAQTGNLDIGIPTGADYDSEFEADVVRALRQQGLQIQPQVGIAGFFIDLAVVDPEVPGRYLLGIECDGATYHSSRSARDRDRLRENVLRSRGWIIHRIWSTDWFQAPDDELRKVLAAVDLAKSEWAGRTSTRPAPRDAKVHQPVDIDRHVPDPSGETSNGSLSIPYEEASFHVPSCNIVEMEGAKLMNLLNRVLKVEEPIHIEELARRAVELTGGKRIGKRSLQAVQRAIRSMLSQRMIEQDGDFYAVTDIMDCSVRDRTNVCSPNLRKPALLPPTEIRAAVLQLVNANCGVTTDEVVTSVARALGFGSTRRSCEKSLKNEFPL